MCFLIGAVHLLSKKLLWNMYLADFLKIYTIGFLFIIMIFFFIFLWLKGCYKKYPADLRATGGLLSIRFFQSNIKQSVYLRMALKFEEYFLESRKLLLPGFGFQTASNYANWVLHWHIKRVHKWQKTKCFM